MNVLLISITVATLGVDYGWKRLPDGGSEYIIQLNRLSLDALRDGQPIQSDVMPAAGEVRSFRIVAGDEKLPQEKPLQKPAKQDTAQNQPPRPPHPLVQDPTVKPLAERKTAFMQPEGKTAADDEESPPATKPAPDRPAIPWLPFTLTLFGLFTSLGANVYLGWLSWGLRQRCRAK